MAQNIQAHPGVAQPARRHFFAGTAKSGALLSTLNLASTGVVGLSLSSLSQAAQTASKPDLLMTLGTRIAIEIQSELGSAESGYSVHFLDAAGPSCDGLKEGLKRAFGRHGVNFEVVQGEQQHALGLVTIRNLDSGRSATVELFPEALSHVDYIERTLGSNALRDQAIMAAPRDSLFSVS
jgi:hypothetical protein